MFVSLTIEAIKELMVAIGVLALSGAVILGVPEVRAYFVGTHSAAIGATSSDDQGSKKETQASSDDASESELHGHMGLPLESHRLNPARGFRLVCDLRLNTMDMNRAPGPHALR